jgi:hypothetical protein
MSFLQATQRPRSSKLERTYIKHRTVLSYDQKIIQPKYGTGDHYFKIIVCHSPNYMN